MMVNIAIIVIGLVAIIFIGYTMKFFKIIQQQSNEISELNLEKMFLESRVEMLEDCLEFSKKVDKKIEKSKEREGGK